MVVLGGGAVSDERGTPIADHLWTMCNLLREVYGMQSVEELILIGQSPRAPSSHEQQHTIAFDSVILVYVVNLVICDSW